MRIGKRGSGMKTGKKVNRTGEKVSRMQIGETISGMRRGKRVSGMRKGKRERVG